MTFTFMPGFVACLTCWHVEAEPGNRCRTCGATEIPTGAALPW